MKAGSTWMGRAPAGMARIAPRESRLLVLPQSKAKPRQKYSKPCHALLQLFKKIFTPACRRHRSIQQLADCKADPPQIIPRDPGALPIDFLRPCFVSMQRVTSHEDISHFAFHSPQWDTGNYLSPLLGVQLSWTLQRISSVSKGDSAHAIGLCATNMDTPSTRRGEVIQLCAHTILISVQDLLLLPLSSQSSTPQYRALAPCSTACSIPCSNALNLPLFCWALDPLCHHRERGVLSEQYSICQESELPPAPYFSPLTQRYAWWNRAVTQDM